MELIFITMAIYAKDLHDVAIINLLDAFLHAENDESVVMFMKGNMAELMVHLAPQIYSKYVSTTKHGEKNMHEHIKALYGMLKNALLLYKNLMKDLEDKGFKLI